MNKVIIGGLAAVLVVGISTWLIVGSDETEPVDEVNSADQSQEEATVNTAPVPGEDVDETVVVGEDEIVSAVVTYKDDGFDPEKIGPITPGSTVKFVNESSRDVWVASNNHPIHSLLPGFDSGVSLSPGEEYEFTFEESGVWEYHNHLNSSETGTIQVGEE